MRTCEFAWVMGRGHRALPCDGTAAVVVTVHRFLPVQSTNRVYVCDRHFGQAVTVLEPLSDTPLEISPTPHGRRLFAGASIECFPNVDVERAAS